MLSSYRSLRLVSACTSLVFTFGCASSTLIRSDPEGADVYINDSKAGTTPYTYSDTKTVGATTRVKLAKDGHEDFETVLKRNEKVEILPLIGGIFFLVPLLWVMGYEDQHNYELKPGKRKTFAENEAAEEDDAARVAPEH
jgi:hypothetical protein